MKRLFPILALFSVVLLSGCAAPSNALNMTVSREKADSSRFDAGWRNSVAVKAVYGGESTSSMGASQIGGAEFKRALIRSLGNASLLADSTGSKYDLTAKILDVEQPMFGLDMTVMATIEYVLGERASNTQVFRKTLHTPYTAKMGDAFAGMTRLRLANEGAARASIARFLDELSGLKPGQGSGSPVVPR